MTADMTHSRPNPGLAAALILLASALIAGTTLFAKALGTGTYGAPLHPLQITFGRFLFAFLALSLAAGVLRPRFTRPNLPVHLLRPLTGAGGVTLMFAAVAFIPLADATAISFLNPVFAMLLAIPILGERVGPWRWAATAIALVGALILLRPGAGSFDPAALLALGAAVLLGFEINIIKILSGREGPFSILLVNNAIGLCLAGTAAFWIWVSPNTVQWALMAGVGVLMAMAQTCFVNAVARADASFVAPISYATLVFAALYDLTVYGVVPDGVTVLGALIIIAGGALLAWREAMPRGNS